MKCSNNDDLGWTFKDDDESRYERATEITMLFDEDDNEWKVDEKEGAHFFVYDGKDPKYEHEDGEWKEADVNDKIDKDDDADEDDDEDVDDEDNDEDEDNESDENNDDSNDD